MKTFLVLFLAFTGSAFAGRHGSGSSHSSHRSSGFHSSGHHSSHARSYTRSSSRRSSSSHHYRPSYSSSGTRDSHGKIKRNSTAKEEFMRQTGYPHGRPGYVVDHVKPLAAGGADDPSNMQWQTKADAKAKDKWELKAYGYHKKHKSKK